MQNSIEIRLSHRQQRMNVKKDSIKFVKNKQLDLENCFVFTFHYSYTKINM